MQDSENRYPNKTRRVSIARLSQRCKLGRFRKWVLLQIPASGGHHLWAPISDSLFQVNFPTFTNATRMPRGTCCLLFTLEICWGKRACLWCRYQAGPKQRYWVVYCPLINRPGKEKGNKNGLSHEWRNPFWLLLDLHHSLQCQLVPSIPVSPYCLVNFKKYLVLRICKSVLKF
jgi:hypothetical protein